MRLFIEEAIPRILAVWINDGFDFPPGDAGGRVANIAPHLRQQRLHIMNDLAGDVSLLSVQRLLSDEAYRRRVIACCRNNAALTFWTQEFPTWTPQFAAQAEKRPRRSGRPHRKSSTQRAQVGTRLAAEPAPMQPPGLCCWWSARPGRCRPGG